MSEMSVKFSKACEQAKKFSKRPPDAALLEIYSLYKQATVGDINTSKPSDLKAKAKWEAWNGKKGVKTDVAKEKYVELVQNLAPDYA